MPRPPRAPLSNAQITAIRRWIEQGALNLSCQNACDTSSYSYTAVIKPIITTNCQGCHSSTAASGGIDLSTYNGLKAKITDGRLWGSVNHYTGFSPMPKNAAKLSDCDLTKIRMWIDSGSPNN
jgi:mono/diheme cytochrome c family protein